MRPYNDLTPKGRNPRLGRVASTALARYGLPGSRIDLYGRDTNHIYRVVAGSYRYVLRLARPGWRTLNDLESEAMWLDAIAAQTDINAPRIVRSQDGEAVLSLTADDIPHVMHATLMTWLPGRLLGRSISPATVKRMGRLTAQLHVHGKEWTPPAGFTSRVFDRFLSRDEPNVLEDESVLVDLTPTERGVIERSARAVASAYASLDRSDLRVIHCDLWHDNIKIHRGELCPFDFEDVTWGFRLHDIAMALLDLKESAGEHYPALVDAYRTGYQEILDWPGGSVDALQVGRMLWRFNHVGRHERKWFAAIVARDLPLLERFLLTGWID